MKLSFLDPVYAHPGPYACAYLDTSSDSEIEDPLKAVQLRWRHLCDDLRAQGADPAALAAAEEAVGCDLGVPGRHGQAIITARGRLTLLEELPEPPVRDSARYGALPDVMGLAVAHAPDVPYVAVLLTRGELETASEITYRIDVDVETGRWPMSAAAPDLRSHWEFPATEWRQGVGDLITQLEDLVRVHGSEVVVLAGDLWSRRDLLHRLPPRLRAVAIDAGADVADTENGRALMSGTLRELFRRRLNQRDQAQVEAFLALRARQPRRTVEGMAAAVTALQRGQAQALLLNPPGTFGQRLWVGPEATHIALVEEDLRSFGVDAPREEPADVALIHAAVGTGAELVVVPTDVVTLADGLGILPRYVDPSPGA